MLGDTAVNKTDRRVKLPPLLEEKQLFKKRERERTTHTAKYTYSKLFLLINGFEILENLKLKM